MIQKRAGTVLRLFALVMRMIALVVCLQNLGQPVTYGWPMDSLVLTAVLSTLKTVPTTLVSLLTQESPPTLHTR